MVGVRSLRSSVGGARCPRPRMRCLPSWCVRSLARMPRLPGRICVRVLHASPLRRRGAAGALGGRRHAVGVKAGRGGQVGGQIRCSSRLVGEGACHRLVCQGTSFNAASQAPRSRELAVASARSAVVAVGVRASCSGRGGGGPTCWCPSPLVRRVVCLSSAASSAPMPRSRQALPCGSLRESCRTRA